MSEPELTLSELGLEASSNDPESSDSIQPSNESPTGGQEETGSSEPTIQPEEGLGEEANAPVEKKVARYTDEEFKNASLAGDGEVDTKRLTPVQASALKASKAWYTKKTQAFAKEQEAYKAMRQKEVEKTQREQDPQGYLYNQFLKNPREMIDTLNSGIDKFENELINDPYNAEIKQKIRNIQKTKEDLLLKRQADDSETKTAETIIARAHAEILQEIPDFGQKEEKLVSFGETLGLTKDELAFISNPLKTGTMAVKLTKALNKMYEIVNAGKTAEKKVSKIAPILGRGGTSSTDFKETSPENLSFEEYREWRNKHKDI